MRVSKQREEKERLPRTSEVAAASSFVSPPAVACASHMGAATPGGDSTAAASNVVEKKVSAVVGRRDFSFATMCHWLVNRLGSLVEWRCKTLPKGRVFPLPTSQQVLANALPSTSNDVLVGLRCLTVGLNSLNGEGIDGPLSVSPMQMRVLEFLLPQCERALEWGVLEDNVSWADFFRCKGVDYRGEEVQTAQYVQWENLSPALPDEIGKIPLESVVEHGCRYYVENFREFLLPADDQCYVKPPRVMVQDEHWRDVAAGLLSKGICRVTTSIMFRANHYLVDFLEFQKGSFRTALK